MLVRKFEADTMAAALKQVKDTLGPEALILSTRTLGKKALGVLGRQTIEVTAAIESPAMRGPAGVRTSSYGERATQQAPRPLSPSNRVETLEDEIVNLSRQATQSKAVPKKALEPVPEEDLRRLKDQVEAQSISELKAEIDQLKELMKELVQARNAGQAVSLSPVPLVPAEVRPETVKQPAPPLKLSTPTERTDPLTSRLLERGIDAESARTIAGYAAQRMTTQQRLDPTIQRDFLCRTLAGLVQTKGVLWSAGEMQKKVALIGATGVGKTTTIAKLAARAMTEQGARVALVTIDTYRIAAVEQLKIYGEIMGIPVEVVFSPEQLQETFRRHRDKDLILIDTAGRSPKDAARIDELNGFLGAHSGVENCLVLAAPTDDRLQRKSLEAFGVLPISSLIFTKLDETDQCAGLINLPLRSNLPLGRLTNGQQVPEDLLPADPQLVAEMVMGVHEDMRRLAV